MQLTDGLRCLRACATVNDCLAGQSCSIPAGQTIRQCVPTSGSCGGCVDSDRDGYGKRYMLATMRVLCGGRIAEEKKTGDVTSGAAMDIRMSTSFARAMLLEWGMSDKLGFVDYTPNDKIETMSPEKAYSENTAQIVDDEIKRLTNEAFADCKQIIEENWAKVEAVADALLRYETINRDDLDRMMRGEILAKPTVGDILKAEAARNKPTTKPPTPNIDGAPGDGTMPAPA